MDTWYHIAQTPAGFHVHRLDPLKVAARAKALRAADPDLPGNEAVAEAQGDYVEAIRTKLGFPPRGRWLTREGWSEVVSPGEPHPNMMRTKLNDDVDDLPDPGPVPTYRSPPAPATTTEGVKP